MGGTRTLGQLRSRTLAPRRSAGSRYRGRGRGDGRAGTLTRPCGSRRIVCVGGDGMFSEVLHGLIGSTQRSAGVDQNEPRAALVPSRLRIGIIPAGGASRRPGHRLAGFPAESLSKRGVCGAVGTLPTGRGVEGPGPQPHRRARWESWSTRHLGQGGGREPAPEGSPQLWRRVGGRGAQRALCGLAPWGPGAPGPAPF